jgi:hypothetical protein
LRRDDVNGGANVTAMLWRMMADFEPPMTACIVTNRGHRFTALLPTQECEAVWIIRGHRKDEKRSEQK